MLPDQSEIINILRQQVLAEQATAEQLRLQNELAAESLRSVERVRQAEAIRNRLWFDIAEQTAGLVQQLPEIKLLLHGFAEKLERLEEVEERLDRIELGLLLLLSGKGNGNTSKAKALVKEVEADHRQKLLYRYYRNLNELQVQLASYGLDKPLKILNEIEDLEQKIDELERELEK